MRLTHTVNTALVESINTRIPRIRAGIVVTKTFHRIKTEAVYPIPFEPISEHVIPLTLYKRMVLVPVVKETTDAASPTD